MSSGFPTDRVADLDRRASGAAESDAISIALLVTVRWGAISGIRGIIPAFDTHGLGAPEATG